MTIRSVSITRERSRQISKQKFIVDYLFFSDPQSVSDQNTVWNNSQEGISGDYADFLFATRVISRFAEGEFFYLLVKYLIIGVLLVTLCTGTQDPQNL